MAKYTDKDGNEVEAFSAEEVQAQVATAVTAKESEFGKTKAQIEAERDEARVALSQRSGEFAQFRKLNEDQVKQLTEKDRIIYENGLALQQANEKAEKIQKDNLENTINGVIKAKAGDNEKLVTKIKDMWSLFGLEATTPEQIENKTKMIIGAIGSTEPDLVASVAGFSGGFQPPVVQKKDGESFGDTERGKAAAAELGIILEAPKKA